MVDRFIAANGVISIFTSVAVFILIAKLLYGIPPVIYNPVNIPGQPVLAPITQTSFLSTLSITQFTTYVSIVLFISFITYIIVSSFNPNPPEDYPIITWKEAATSDNIDPHTGNVFAGVFGTILFLGGGTLLAFGTNSVWKIIAVLQIIAGCIVWLARAMQIATDRGSNGGDGTTPTDVGLFVLFIGIPIALILVVIKAARRINS